MVKLLLGGALLALAARAWQGRPSQRDHDGALPGWMQAVDTFTTPRSLAMGLALSGINPKNAMLTLGAAAAIAQTGMAAGAQAGSLAVFALIGTIGPGAPLAIYLLLGDRAPRLLGALKA